MNSEPLPEEPEVVGIDIPPFVHLAPAANDAFAPVLTTSTPVTITEEQERAVRALLLLTSSDTNFAQKAADGLRVILSGGVNQGIVPVLNSVEPATGVVNTQNLKIKCKGTGFDANCKIYMDGNLMPTSFTSSTEVFTNVNLPATPKTIQVQVRASSGASSAIKTFTVTATMADEPAEEEVAEEPPVNPFEQ